MSTIRTARRSARLIAIACVAVTVAPGSAQAFNPQPDPPGIASRTADPAVVVTDNPPSDLREVIVSHNPPSNKADDACVDAAYPPDPYLTTVPSDPYRR